MKAIYPGSFDPWHKGHSNIVEKALTVFPKVVIAKGYSGAKTHDSHIVSTCRIPNIYKIARQIEIKTYRCLLAEFVSSYNEEHTDDPITAIVRGLRSSQDFQYEQAMQYCNEDLGIKIPVVYFISDRNVCHVSSTACRQVKQFSNDTQYGMLWLD